LGAAGDRSIELQVVHVWRFIVFTQNKGEAVYCEEITLQLRSSYFTYYVVLESLYLSLWRF